MCRPFKSGRDQQTKMASTCNIGHRNIMKSNRGRRVNWGSMPRHVMPLAPLHLFFFSHINMNTSYGAQNAGFFTCGICGYHIKRRKRKRTFLHLGDNDKTFVRSAPSRASRPCSFFHLQMSVFQLLRVLLEKSNNFVSVVVGEDGFSV